MSGGRRLLAVALLLLLPACGEDVAQPAAAGSPALSGTVTVLAAASLTDAFEEIGAAFEQAHPGVDVVFGFGGSSAVAQQVLSGAPADVLATASPATMTTVTDAGDARPPAVFARNRLEIAVPAGNPGAVTGIGDFARPELTLALCAPQVPCGAAAAAVFASLGVRPVPDTLESDVRAALSKVLLGEVDAALVYRSDVRSAGDAVEGIAVPAGDEAANDYPLAVLAQAPNPAAAAAFASAVLSDEGQRVLADAGFDPA